MGEAPFPFEKASRTLFYRGHPSCLWKGRLLYIGKTDTGIGNRLSYHEEWVDDESDLVKVRVASVGEFTNWEELEKDPHYPKADANIVGKIEALLIYAHQPAYNTRGKSSLGPKIRIRIFNTGKSGLLLPELSYLYYVN